jgi:hypothetical protein
MMNGFEIFVGLMLAALCAAWMTFIVVEAVTR